MRYAVIILAVLGGGALSAQIMDPEPASADASLREELQEPLRLLPPY